MGMGLYLEELGTTAEAAIEQLQERQHNLERVLENFFETARRAPTVVDVNIAAGLALEEMGRL